MISTVCTDEHQRCHSTDIAAQRGHFGCLNLLKHSPCDSTATRHAADAAFNAGKRCLAQEHERQEAERERPQRQAIRQQVEHERPHERPQRQATPQAERERLQRLQQAAQQAERQRLRQVAQQAEHERLRQAALLAAQQAERERLQQAAQQAERERLQRLQQAAQQAERQRLRQVAQQAEREREQADLLLQITKGDIKQSLSLIRKGETDLTLTNSDEETAFHLASRLGQRGVLLALFQAGADPECINIHGDRPVDLAKDAATRKCFHNAPRRSVNPSGPQQSVSPPRTRPGPPPSHPVSNTLPGTHRSVPSHGTNPFMGAEASRPTTQHSSSSPRAPIAQASADTAVPVRDIATYLAKLKQFASETSKYHGNNGTVVALGWLDKALASEMPYDPAQLREYVRIVSELAVDQSRRLHDADPDHTKPCPLWSEHHELSQSISRNKVVEDMKYAHFLADNIPIIPAVDITFNTGKGNNSRVKGNPVIRPMVEHMLQDYERIRDPNTGLVIIRVHPNTPNRVREFFLNS